MTYAIDKIKEEIKSSIIAATGENIDPSNLLIETPPNPEMGDFAVSCFYLSKLLRRSPNILAEELKTKIKPSSTFKSVQNIGPYVNFFLNSKNLAQKTLKEIESKGSKFGQLKAEKEKLMIEYSQPNTHKEFHVGHLRNAILGSILVNTYRFGGKKVIAANYIGDIGSHVAKCLWALEKFHAGEEPKEHKGQFLGAIYTEACQKIEENEEFKKEAAEIQVKLENGDKKLLALWKKTRAWSLDNFNDIYKTLDIKFDKFFYESEVEKPGKKLVADLLEKKIAEKSKGAVIIDLDKYKLKQFLLLKSDGSSLYSTKELALAKLKFEKFKIDASYIIVDNRQSFYFQQFFKTLEIMGFKEKTAHISYEFVTLKDGAMASRKGNVIIFEDFFAEIIKKTNEETAKRHSDWSPEKIAKTAENIALSAIKFNMIKVGNNSIIVFDMEEALSFDGFTGPYLQYTVSRINSIFRKEKAKSLKEVDLSLLNSELEKEILIKLAEFPESIKKVIESNEPSVLAKYLFELAKSFSRFYQEVPIITSEEKIKFARLSLISAVKQVLVNGLTLLGIKELEEM